MRFMSIAVAASLVLTPLSAQAAKYSFEGSWNCEVGTFTFTDTTYHNGSELMKFSSVKRDGKNFIISFPDNYRIGLSNISAKTMVWSSGETGDTFTCKRIK